MGKAINTTYKCIKKYMKIMLDNSMESVYNLNMAKREIAKKVAISILPSDLKKLDELAQRAQTSRSGLIADMTRLMYAVPDSKEIGLLMADSIKRAIEKR